MPGPALSRGERALSRPMSGPSEPRTWHAGSRHIGGRGLLKPVSSDLVFLMCQGPSGLAERAPAVSGALMSMLLNGGCGHEVRLLPPVPVDHRLRSAVRHARSGGPARELATLQHREAGDDQYRITMAVAGFSPA